MNSITKETSISEGKIIAEYQFERCLARSNNLFNRIFRKSNPYTFNPFLPKCKNDEDLTEWLEGRFKFSVSWWRIHASAPDDIYGVYRAFPNEFYQSFHDTFTKLYWQHKGKRT